MDAKTLFTIALTALAIALIISLIRVYQNWKLEQELEELLLMTDEELDYEIDEAIEELVEEQWGNEVEQKPIEERRQASRPRTKL